MQQRYRAYSKRADLGLRAGAILLLLCPLLTGCPYAGLAELFIPYDYVTDPNGDESLATARVVQWSGDTAIAAGAISFDAARLATIRAYFQGEIVGNNVPPPTEVDVFALGELEAGDRISVSVQSLAEQIVNLTPLAEADIVQNGLSTLVVLVDADQRIIGYPAAAEIAVESTGEYYLVVDSPVPGDYTFTITRRRNQGSVPPRRGVLLLKFGGGEDLNTTFVGDVHTIIRVDELPPFDLEEARPDLVGQTERFKEMIRQIVSFIYADYDILVTLDPEEAKAADYFDLIVFTSASPAEVGFPESLTPLGIEPTIDVEDQTGQVGIIFIQTLERALYYDFNTFCAMWGTVAAHEYGHAIGLWHVEQECSCLMAPSIDTTINGRVLKLLKQAAKKEYYGASPLELIQDPDSYL